MSETNRERLRRFKSEWDGDDILCAEDIDWLIGQAERAQELEGKWVTSVYDNTKLKLENEQLQSEIKVVKYRKGEPTVIDWNGERWIKDSQTTFEGGVQRGKTRAQK